MFFCVPYCSTYLVSSETPTFCEAKRLAKVKGWNSGLNGKGFAPKSFKKVFVIMLVGTKQQVALDRPGSQASPASCIVAYLDLTLLPQPSNSLLASPVS